MMLAGFLFLLLLTGGGTNADSGSLLEGGSTSGDSEPVDAGSSTDHEEDINGYSGTFDPLGDRSRDEDRDDYSFFTFSWEDDSPVEKCSHIDIINHLNLSDKVKFSMTRPVKDHGRNTTVYLNPKLHAILDVKEKEQKFIAHIGIRTLWHNELISWNPPDFCDIDYLTLPVELLWKPDLTIGEMTERNKAFNNPYLNVNSRGLVTTRSDVVLVSTCRMQFFKFPVDTQSCRLTFTSMGHFATALYLKHVDYDNKSLENIRDEMHADSEWKLINVTVESKEVNNFGPKSQLIYTLTIRRRSVLYVVNFILPILFFLCLDLASFLILESGGEKLSFKVTVLLAVTVMQLILNEILPSTSDQIPLIAIYCIGVFGLMMMSLLETILVMYLIGKDSASQDAEKKQSLSDDCRDKRGSSSQLIKESHDLENISEELSEVVKTLALLLSNRTEAGKPGYWTRASKTINKIYFIFYIISASLFLGFLFSVWFDEGN